MSSQHTKAILDALKSQDQEKADQLTVAAYLSRLPAQQLAEVQGAWGRVCKRAQDANERQERRDKILGLVQEALVQLRLDMKYLCFDLEATKRERDELQRRIDGGS